jgi:hypothetical protein
MGAEPPDPTDDEDAELPLQPQALASPRLPQDFDLRGMTAQTNFRRRGRIALLLVCSLFLVVLWGLSEFLWNVTQGSPVPVAAHLLIGLVLLGPAAYFLWRGLLTRPAKLPVAVSVTEQGFTLRFQGGGAWATLWSDPKAEAFLRDVTATDYYPGWAPSGFNLSGPFTEDLRVWIPEQVFNAIMASAHAGGAQVTQREVTRVGWRTRPATGTLVYHLRGITK